TPEHSRELRALVEPAPATRANAALESRCVPWRLHARGGAGCCGIIVAGAIRARRQVVAPHESPGTILASSIAAAGRGREARSGRPDRQERPHLSRRVLLASPFCGCRRPEGCAGGDALRRRRRSRQPPGRVALRVGAPPFRPYRAGLPTAREVLLPAWASA